MKKITGFLVCLMVIIPIYSQMGAAQNLKMMNIESTPSVINPDIIDMINQVNESLISYYLEKLVEFGPRFVGSESCRRAAEYIYDEFMDLGLNVYIDSWRYPRYRCQNVIATLEGVDLSSDAMFILCAHYDTSKESPGANDDGSGIAAILAIANICSQYSFNHTIRFIAFSGEEVGLFGSHDYARKSYENRENIVAVLNIDTIGNTTAEGGKILYLLKTDRSEWISTFSKNISQSYLEYIDLSVVPVGNRRNDHQAFLNYGYDAVQFVQLARGEYPLHTPDDTIDKINYTYLVKVIKLILAITAELASTPIDVQIRIVTPYEGHLYLFDRPVFQLPGFNLFRTELRGMTYVLGRATARVNIITKEEITSVAFCIDGVASFPGFLQHPPYEWKIQISPSKIFPITGKHTLGVYVCTRNGKTAYDEMDIYVLTMS